MKLMLAMIFIISNFSWAQENHEIKYDKLIEEKTVSTKEYSSIAEAETELKELINEFHSKHAGDNIVIGEPETMERTESTTYEKGIYKTRIDSDAGERRYKHKLKVRFRPMLIINKCYGNKLQSPIKFYRTRNGLKEGAKSKKVGSETATKEKTYYKMEIDLAAFKYEPPKEEPKILYRESEEVKILKSAWERSKENKPSHKPCEEYGFNGPNHKGKTCAVDPEEGGIYVITYDPNASKPSSLTTGGGDASGKKTTTKEISRDGGKTWEILEQKVEEIKVNQN